MEHQRLIREINEHKETESNLRDSVEMFSKSFHSAPFLMVLVDLDSRRRIDVNEKFTQITGYKSEEIVNTNINEINLHVNHSEKFEEGLKILAKKGSLKNFSLPIRTKAGKERILLYSGEIINLGDGRRYALMAAEDITERKQAEEKMKSRNIELEIFYEATVNRELTMIELKKEINELLEDKGEKPKYKIIA